ncbi:superoxide dismutase [Candidatus Gottesmanbacteria bacterium RBG_16_52_11]|uniref:Superoxide dismutase n=1 Tax=Candidatus Gottesmanbacteria bacterium RBG_16_52_11 TaxID=1798374 RepID=A0A1F5YMX1_9BACT|nr:MAG: superoxide dismutase [Candidatus Gottesmanbacteria bacterium RBG_16_52_11]
MKYSLPKLPYAYDALEPHIDAKTMEIHHTKHHQAYIDKLNAVLEKYPKLADAGLSDLMRGLEKLDMSPPDRKILQNHGGGYLNHSLFWTIMGPQKEPDKNLISRISQTFGSVAAFTEKFTETATNHFGSGWAWLVDDGTGKLDVYSLPNQDSPYLRGHTPVLGLDVWEHAYYLKYQNRRAEYIKSWWNVLKLL